MGDNRRFWIALISIDLGGVLNFGSSACPNECSQSVSVFMIIKLLHNLPRLPSICNSNVLATEYTKFYFVFHFSHFEKEAPAAILAAILTTHVLFAGKMVAWCVRSTDWLITSLSITRINALMTGVSPVNSHCDYILYEPLRTTVVVFIPF